MRDQEVGGVRWGLVAGVGFGQGLVGVGCWLHLGTGHAVAGEDVEEVGFCEGEAEGAEGDAQFVIVEVAVAV